jgi:hypothetical protein
VVAASTGHTSDDQPLLQALVCRHPKPGREHSWDGAGACEGHRPSPAVNAYRQPPSRRRTHRTEVASKAGAIASPSKTDKTEQ